MKAALLAAATLLAAASSPAWSHGRGHHHHHHRSGVHFGIMLGAPLWPAYGYGYGYPAYPRPVVIREEPQVYIEKGNGEAGAPPAGGQSWYYCRSSEMYYPYTKHCPGGWERVAPQPQP